MKTRIISRDAQKGAGLLALLMLLCCHSTLAFAAALDSQSLLNAIEADCEAKLGVDVSLNLLDPLPAIASGGGEPQLSLRYPHRPGQWLPQTLVVSEDGRLIATLPLYRYVEFSLPVLVAPEGLSARSLVRTEQVAAATMSLRAGKEVLCDSALAVGCESRMTIKPGAQLLQSSLRAPYDIRRGEELTLILRLPGMEVKAGAVALADAYIGQRITVRRSDDRMQFCGVLSKGPQVVVE